MARISKERKREKFVRVVYVDARRGNIFRACKPLKSRVIGQASPRGREWEGSLGGGEMTREKRKKGRRTGERARERQRRSGIRKRRI